MSVPHMGTEEFRRRGHELVDWVADYHATVGDRPVLSTIAPGATRARLKPSPPEVGDAWDDVRRDLDDVIMAGITHWQSPGFFAYFPANVSGPAILGELVSAGLGIQGMLWATSPAATELEELVLDWLVDLCGLPDHFRSGGPGGGVIQDSASSAALCALVAARERARRHAPLDRLVAYVSTETHSSVEKGARVCGLEPDGLRKIPTDDRQRMDPTALGRAIDIDIGAGRVPFFVAVTAGTTSTTAFDPVGTVTEIAHARDAWVHLDAAYAGSAAVCPELRWVIDGVDAVDSYCFNPHKWLLTNFDCTAFYVADRRWLTDALSIQPEYLRNEASESGAVVDYRDWQIPLGRRFRALKLWMVIRHYGAEGLRTHIRDHVASAAWLAGQIEAHPDVELGAEPTLGLVCFRHRAGDDAGRRLLDELNRSGRVYLTHALVDGRFVLRVAIGATATTRAHVERLWRQISSLVERRSA